MAGADDPASSMSAPMPMPMTNSLTSKLFPTQLPPVRHREPFLITGTVETIRAPRPLQVGGY
jgi:hypothetical protein